MERTVLNLIVIILNLEAGRGLSKSRTMLLQMIMMPQLMRVKRSDLSDDHP
jgi:ABC-type arginine transport system permease subunit